jgi:hypothetical protein
VARRSLVVLAALGGVAAWLAATHAGGRSRPELPPAIGAYAAGGAPDRDPDLEDLFGEQLAELAVSTDEARHGKSDSERDRAWTTKQLRVAPAIVRRGPWLLSAWQDFLDSLARWSDAPYGSRGYHAAERDLRMRAHDLTDQLATLDLRTASRCCASQRSRGLLRARARRDARVSRR